MKRRLLACLLFGFGASGLLADVPFDFEVLQFRAKELAAAPYTPKPSPVPDALRSLTYDQYRDIRYNPVRTWWRRERLPFELQFFHPGFIYNDTVQLNEVERGKVRPIEFDTDLFTYGPSTRLGSVSGNIGFTGLRVHHELNTPGVSDELVVFQGASYFRALGKGMRYGMSARGLALDTAESTGEEFPVFTDFWVEKPVPMAKSVVIYALMNSRSVAGAYRFTVTPGPSTVVEVRAAVYMRKDVKVFGIAPLTSMFWHGENSEDRAGDFRPEVHDSDGLLIERGSGEWFFRPLVGPKSIRVSSFADQNPKGFGLIQRDRRFDSYEDLEAYYHQRPSTWVEPIGAWGSGEVRLVELPTPDETNDNIVAFWLPAKLPPPGEAYEFAYRLHWFMENQAGARTPPAGYATATRIGHSKTHEPDLQRFVVDFTGNYLRARGSDASIQADVSVGKGAKLVHQSLEKNPFNGSWRVAFAIRPDGSGQPVELRCFLKRSPNILTETWSYLWNP